MRLNRRAARPGAASAEAAITVTAFLTLVIGAIDLGTAVARFNTLSQAARYGARRAAVHGYLSTVSGSSDPNWTTPWEQVPSPVTVTTTATGVRAVDAVRPMLVNCPLNSTQVQVQWLDGSVPGVGNTVGKRVRVTVTSSYQPILTAILGQSPVTLSASSTVLFSH